jgi:hypothetical protein
MKKRLFVKAAMPILLSILLLLPVFRAKAENGTDDGLPAGADGVTETTGTSEDGAEAADDQKVAILLGDGAEATLTDEYGNSTGTLTGTQEGLLCKQDDKEYTVTAFVRPSQIGNDPYLKQIGDPAVWRLKIVLQFDEESGRGSETYWVEIRQVQDSECVLSAINQTLTESAYLEITDTLAMQQNALEDAMEELLPQDDADNAGAQTDSLRTWWAEYFREIISWALIALIATALFLILFAVKKLGKHSEQRNRQLKARNEFDVSAARTEPMRQIAKLIQNASAVVEPILPEVADIKKQMGRIVGKLDPPPPPPLPPGWEKLTNFANTLVQTDRPEEWQAAFRSKQFDPQSIRPGLNLPGLYETTLLDNARYLAAFRHADENGREELYIIPSCNDPQLHSREVQMMFDLEEGDVDTSGYYKIKRPAILIAENAKYYKLQQKGLLIVRKKS